MKSLKKIEKKIEKEFKFLKNLKKTVITRIFYKKMFFLGKKGLCEIIMGPYQGVLLSFPFLLPSPVPPS